MIISVTNIWHTQMIVRKTTIEKTISGINKKMLEKCTIKTQSSSNCQTVVGIPIARRSLGDQGINNCLMATKRQTII
jgi:hypothetical protein